MKKLNLVMISLIAVMISAGCSGSIDYSSKWAKEPVQTDGTGEQWKGKTSFIKEGGLLFGVQNDSDNLYIVLTTSDRGSKAQMIMSGFTVWFDTKGGDNKAFGIRYPIGARESGLMILPKGPEDNEGQDRMQHMEDDALNSTTLEVMDDENDGRKMEFQDATGITVKLSRSNDVLIYELKIAMKETADNRYAIGVNSIRQIVGLGIETGGFQENKKMGENGPRGDMGRGNHGPGPGPGDRGSNRPSMPDPIKLWFTVQLAKNPDVKIK